MLFEKPLPFIVNNWKKKCFVAHHLLLTVEWDMPWDIKAILMYGLFTSLFDFSAWNQDPLMSNVFFPFPFHPYFFFHAPSSSPLPVVLLSPFISRTGNGPSTPQGKLLKHNNMPFLTSLFLVSVFLPLALLLSHLCRWRMISREKRMMMLKLAMLTMTL